MTFRKPLLTVALGLAVLALPAPAVALAATSKPSITAPALVKIGRTFTVRGRFPAYHSKPVTVYLGDGSTAPVRLLLGQSHTSARGAWVLTVKLTKAFKPGVIRLNARAGTPVKGKPSGLVSPTIMVTVTR